MVPLKNTYWRIEEGDNTWYYKYLSELLSGGHTVLSHKGISTMALSREFGTVLTQVVTEEELGMLALMFLGVEEKFFSE